jgi:hypothetical protein
VRLVGVSKRECRERGSLSTCFARVLRKVFRGSLEQNLMIKENTSYYRKLLFDRESKLLYEHSQQSRCLPVFVFLFNYASLSFNGLDARESFYLLINMRANTTVKIIKL